MSRRAVGSVLEIAPGIWRVWVEAPINPNTGKRRRLTKVVRGTQRDAEAVLARMLLEVGKQPDTDLTVREYLEQMYLPHAKKRVRVRTSADYRSKIQTHITPKLGDVPLADLSPYQLDSWLDEVKGSDQTRLHVYRVLCASLNQAVRWRLIERNPLHAVEPPKVRREPPETLTLKEAKAYITAFEGHPVEPIVLLAIGCGLRRSELAALTWEDFDFKAGTVTIAKTHHDHAGGVIVEDPKSTTSHRVIAVPEWVLGRLRGIRGIGALVTEHGQPMKPWRISDEYGKQVEIRRLRRVTLKNLRHTHACLMLQAGVDIYTVSRRLGHSTVAVTEKHYVKPSQSADRAAADAFDPMRHRVTSDNESQLHDRQ